MKTSKSVSKFTRTPFVTSESGGETLPNTFSPETMTRIAGLAERSGISTEQWIDSVLASAIACDESHWREVEELDAAASKIDRGQFAVMSRSLSALPDGVVDLLVGALARARVEGRAEGRAQVAPSQRPHE